MKKNQSKLITCNNCGHEFNPRFKSRCPKCNKFFLKEDQKRPLYQYGIQYGSRHRPYHDWKDRQKR